MGFLDRFRKKKVEEKTEEISDLERICMGDKEVYEALRRTMLLDPRKVGVPIKEAIKRAKDFEKQKDKLRAKTWYEVAGGLAIYEGDVEKVKEYFGKCVKLSPESNYAILKIPEKAVSKAQEYYQKYLK